MNSPQLQLYITAESSCSYYDDRTSANLVPDPQIPLNMSIYNQLIQHGFRRSGEHAYRPHCKNCQACVACRILAHSFTANRSQQRCEKANQDLSSSVTKAKFSEEYFELYCRYLNSRHLESSMANPSKEDFEQFLYCEWSETHFLEIRLAEKLVAIAVMDIISDGVSAVYSFFDPDMQKRSLGTYCILKQIEHAKISKLDFVYLGYWIENHNKMHYKRNFKPLQIYQDDAWVTLEPVNKAIL